MSNLKSRLIGFNTACILACVSVLAHAASPSAASTVNTTSVAASSAVAEILSARPIVGDDAVAIRDVLAKHSIHGNAPSLRDRIRALIPYRKTLHDRDLTKASLDRVLVFVVPVPYGVLYRSQTHVLTIDADLASEDEPGAILLKKTVDGPDGRGLTVAAEAKAKGYIQQIDLIGLKSDATSKTRIHGHLTLPPSAFAKVDGDFAIALMCSLSAPYLSDRREHSDPTDDEPTDITTRTSIIYTDIQAAWLISPQTGMVLSKNLHLSN
ncbi:MAG: hypothetical protein ABSD12_20265 [Paraburkholderia sp.]